MRIEVELDDTSVAILQMLSRHFKMRPEAFLSLMNSEALGRLKKLGEVLSQQPERPSDRWDQLLREIQRNDER
jgi:hypothetical protein